MELFCLRKKASSKKLLILVKSKKTLVISLDVSLQDRDRKREIVLRKAQYFSVMNIDISLSVE